MSAFERGHRVLQREYGRCAAATVFDGVGLALPAVEQRVQRRKQDRRRMVDGRIDDPMIAEGIAARMGQDRIVFHKLSDLVIRLVMPSALIQAPTTARGKCLVKPRLSTRTGGGEIDGKGNGWECRIRIGER